MRNSVAAIIFALFLAEIAVTFESTMVYAALPTLIREFGDPLTAGWLVTSHLLIAAATAPMVGRLGDIRGRKSLILFLVALALAGSVISALSTSLVIVLIGRALQGLSAAVLPLAIGVVREALDAKRVPVAIGILTTGQGVGSASGLILGGAIVDNLHWQWLFWASALLLAITFVAVLLFVPSRSGTPTSKPIDWLEGLLPLPGIAGILFAISQTKQYGLLSVEVIGLLAASFVLMAWWARRSLASKEPFIDLRLFTQRNFAVANGIQIMIGMGTMQMILVFSNYIQSPEWTLIGLGLTATMAGLAKLPSNFLSLLAGPLAGWLALRIGSRKTVILAAMLAAFGWTISLIMPDQLIEVILILCMISFGTTMLQAAVPNIVVQSVPENRTSEAVGSMSVVRGIASAIGAQMIALALASSTVVSPEGTANFPSSDAYRLTFSLMLMLTLGGIVLGTMLQRQDRRPVAPQA